MQAPVPNTPSRLVIATRESRLALWQANHVQALLRQLGVADVSLLGMTTQGDQILDRALSKVGGKGLFVKELEVALSEGRADLAVHSLKDVPMELPEGFILAAVMVREDPRDAFVSPRYASLTELPLGAVVGTSSLRRLVQLKAVRPDLRIEALRGNLDTRLRKLDEGQYDAIILAAAGLKRLGLAERIRAHIAPEQMLPAAGQGALGLEIRATDPALNHAVQTLAHWPTWLACTAERATIQTTDTASFGTTQRLHLRSLLGHAEQPGLLHAEEAADIASLPEAEALGLRVANELKRQAPEGWLPHC